MHVGLVPHVEDEFILWKIEHFMQGENKLDRAEVGGKVPPFSRTVPISCSRNSPASPSNCFML